MLLKVLAEVVSLRAFTVSKQGSGSIDLTLPEQDFGREENLCKSGQPLNTPLVDCGKQLFR